MTFCTEVDDNVPLWGNYTQDVYMARFLFDFDPLNSREFLVIMPKIAIW